MFNTGEKLDQVNLRLNEVCALLDHMSGQLESIARLLRMLVEQDSIVFEAETDEDGEALTA